MKKDRFTCKFIHDFFSNKNTIIRKNDGYRWQIHLNFWNITTKDGWEPLTEEYLAKFFDKDNNFLFEEYDLIYIDYFKEWQKEELRKHGKELIESLPFGETKENILKQIMG